jgi:hypothetical protein
MYIYVYIYRLVFITFGWHKIEFVSLSTSWKLPEAPCLFKMCWDILIDYEMSIAVIARILTLLWVAVDLHFATDLWSTKISSMGMKRVGVPEDHCLNLSKLRRRTGHAETEKLSNRAKLLYRTATDLCYCVYALKTWILLYQRIYNIAVV